MTNTNLKDTLGDICAVVSLLIKFGSDDILENRPLFIAFLNELGITINNKKVTLASLNDLTLDVTTREKKEIIQEFLVGHEPINRKLTMVLNNPRLV